MIRVSKHNITNETNLNKINHLDNLFVDYKSDLEHYIDLIINGILPLKINASSKELPTITIKHSKYRREIYKQASQIIRSQIDRAKNKRFKRYKTIYKYFLSNGRQTKFINKKFSELKIKNILKSKYFTKPSLKNITINLTDEFYDIQEGKYFDLFLSLKLPYFNEKGTRAIQIKIPVKHHRQSNRFRDEWKQLSTIQLKHINNKYYINFLWEKESPKKKEEGKVIGIDLGYNKLIVTSDNQYIGSEMKEVYLKINKRIQNSKGYKRAIQERDNKTNYYVNHLDLSNVSTIIVEDLLNVKKGSNLGRRTNNNVSRWVYRKVLNKLEMNSEEHGVLMVKVSPAYTSQMCSRCGKIHKESRQGERYLCVECGYEIDADYNASVNIYNRGIYSFSA